LTRHGAFFLFAETNKHVFLVERLQAIPSSPNSHASRNRSGRDENAIRPSCEQLILKPPSQVIVPGMKHLITLPGMPL
jgi:hypothetical protein